MSAIFDMRDAFSPRCGRGRERRQRSLTLCLAHPFPSVSLVPSLSLSLSLARAPAPFSLLLWIPGKCNYRDVLAKLKSDLSADTSQVLDGLLVELKVGGDEGRFGLG